MRFENIRLENLDTDLGSGTHEGNYVIPSTDELIAAANNVRKSLGFTDLVGPEYKNDVYYTFYLYFNADEKRLSLQVEVAESANDDYVCYVIELLPGEKDMLMWKLIKQLFLDTI